MATQKQVGYALHLLQRAGYGTRYMDASFKKLGATMRERSGKVDAWLAHKSAAECSELIGQLRKQLGEG